MRGGRVNGARHYTEGERLLDDIDTQVLSSDEVLAEAALAGVHFLAALVATQIDTSETVRDTAIALDWARVLA